MPAVAVAFGFVAVLLTVLTAVLAPSAPRVDTALTARMCTLHRMPPGLPVASSVPVSEAIASMWAAECAPLA